MNKFTVLKDTREKDGKGWWFEEDEYCAGTVQTKVDYGDYAIKGLEDKFSIERKASVSEVATNINEKRFKAELEVLADFPHKLIILEFDWQDILRYPEGSGIPKYKRKYIKVSGNFIMSCLANIYINYNIPVIAAGNKFLAEKLAYVHLKRINSKYASSV